jgi:mitofusin
MQVHEAPQYGFDSGYQSHIRQDSSEVFQKTRNSLVYFLNQTSTLLEHLPQITYPPNSTLLKSGSTTDVLNYLDKLLIRIQNKQSRVLVTGDLNAGKSTLVNTLLRRQVVPDDQEPCTALFVEVVDAAENDGVEVVHGIHEPDNYNRLDASTYKSIPIEGLREEVENDEPQFQLLKAYCKDSQESSLLHNGLVDVSLIDSPGLNIDSMKTTALFSKQEEIDVVVFVVNAENHFTLSGKEFLTTATKEKAFVFIVVNRFDSIRRKDRNRREILEQIREISPATFVDAQNLVHFVSSRKVFEHRVLGIQPDDPHWVADFEHLENCLKSFILDRRMISKLAPAKTYLKNVLEELNLVTGFNIDQLKELSEKIQHEISQSEPEYQAMELLNAKYFLRQEEIIVAMEERIGEVVEQRLVGFLNGVY